MYRMHGFAHTFSNLFRTVWSGMSFKDGSLLTSNKIISYSSSKANWGLTTLHVPDTLQSFFQQWLLAATASTLWMGTTFWGQPAKRPDDVKASFIRSWKNSCRGPPSSTDGSSTKTTFNSLDTLKFGLENPRAASGVAKAGPGRARARPKAPCSSRSCHAISCEARASG